MVHTSQRPDGQWQIVLRPNRSMSWRGNMLMIALVTLITVLIGTFFLLQGIWLILPFGLLEVSAFAAATIYLLRRGMRQEVITLSPDRVTIETGAITPDTRHELQRYWTRFHIEPPRYRWYDPEILVRGPGLELTIGSFLNRADKELLVRELRTTVNTLNHANP